MPNYCSNYIKIEFKEKAAVDAVLDAILDENREIDFNRLVPMPAILEKIISCGSKEIDGESVDVWIEDGPVARTLSLAELAEVKDIGYADWYDWSIAKWGTKWNAISTDVDESEKDFGEVDITFETAWTPPVPVFFKMKEMFVDVAFEFRCRFEDDHQYPHEIKVG